jgi:hypothetical protein
LKSRTIDSLHRFTLIGKNKYRMNSSALIGDSKGNPIQNYNPVLPILMLLTRNDKILNA